MDAATTERFVKRFLDGMQYEAERTAPPEGFPRFPSIPGGRYTNPEFLEAERQALWKRTWLYACHVDELPDAGSFMLWTKTGSPILIVRGKDMKIRAFYNTCRHRGAPLVKTETGRCDGLVCSYHGWTYALDGQLVNLRDKRDFVDLDTGDHSLVAVRCEQFANWVFVNEDPDAQPLLENIAPFPDHFAQFQPEQPALRPQEGLRPQVQREGAARCLPRGLPPEVDPPEHGRSLPRPSRHDHRAVSQRPFADGDAEPPAGLGGPGHQGHAARRDGHGDLGEEQPVVELLPEPRRAHRPVGLSRSCCSGRPATTRCASSATGSRPDWGGGEMHPLWPTRIQNFERILDEDLQFAEQIQKSVESPGFRGMTLNYQERRIYHWHEELDRRIDRAGVRIPDALRVKPLLAPYYEN